MDLMSCPLWSTYMFAFLCEWDHHRKTKRVCDDCVDLNIEFVRAHKFNATCCEMYTQKQNYGQILTLFHFNSINVCTLYIHFCLLNGIMHIVCVYSVNLRISGLSFPIAVRNKHLINMRERIHFTIWLVISFLFWGLYLSSIISQID